MARYKSPIKSNTIISYTVDKYNLKVFITVGPTPRLHRNIQLTLLAGSLCIALLYGVLFYAQILGPGVLLGTSPINLIIAGVHVIYFLFVRQFISSKSMTIATAIDLGLFSLNLLILMLATGGLDSPYLPFWLLTILFSAAVGKYAVATYVGVTLVYLTIVTFLGSNWMDYALNNGVYALAVLSAGILGWWLWRNHPDDSSSRNKAVSDLTEKLEVEQLKSDILLKSIGDGVMVIDLSGTIQLFNPPATTITGWPEDEATDINYKQVIELEDEDGNLLNGADDPFNIAITKKKAVKRNDVTTTNRNKKRLYLSLTVAPIFASSDHVTGAVAVFSDISKEKESARQRNEFISTASHEMRTPVAAIEGFLALAMNPKVSTIDENAKKYIDKAHESTQHLGQLFRDLLSITKAEDGRLQSNPKPFDLGKTIRNAIDELKFKAEEKNLELKLKNPNNVSTTNNVMPLYYVNADPERVREVFVNLVDNAIKFTPEGQVTVSIDGDDRQVTVGVHDEGIGIPENEIKHLFQKFYRVDNGKTREIGGTGLGLYLCRTIIEMYNGRIWVESEENKGSDFYFTLPRLTYSQAQELRDKLEKHTANQSKSDQSKTDQPSTGEKVAPGTTNA